MKHLERALDGQNQFWKYLLNFVAGFAASNIIGAIPLGAVVAYKIATGGGSITPNPHNTMDLSAYGISQNLGFILLMIPFVLAFITTIMLFKPLHKRLLAEVINGTKQIRWKRYFTALGVWFIICLLYLAADYAFNSTNYKLQFDAAKFIPLVLLSMLFIPIQTGYEELLFRGYFTQGIAAWTGNRWVAIIFPALLFGLMHSFNPEVKEYGFWATMPQYVLFGLLFGLMTISDDGIELAMGAHAANNIFSCLFVTNSASALQTPAVFNQLNINPTKETLALTIMGILSIIIFSRLYKWNFAVLNKKIEPQTLEVVEE